MVNARLIWAAGVIVAGALGISKGVQYHTNDNYMGSTARTAATLSQQREAYNQLVLAAKQREILAIQEQEQAEALHRKLTAEDERILLTREFIAEKNKLPLEFTNAPQKTIDLHRPAAAPFQTCDPAKTDYCRVQVFFGTDRKPTPALLQSGTRKPTEYFTGERNNSNSGPDDNAITFGTCMVSIPAHHVTGNLEGPFWGFSPDPRKHVTIVDLTLTSESNFSAHLNQAIEGSPVRDALVFIHGFDVSFDEAARRAAQLAWDLQFPGVPILYSWPSAGSVFSYTADEASATWTIPHLKRFLKLVAEKSGAQKIHIVAHSLGNRALINALKDIAAEANSGTAPRFRQVILAAPDIDRDVFSELAAVFPLVSDHVTIYASTHDKALGLSRILHHYPSVGSSPLTIKIPSIMDVIDASLMSAKFFSFDHSYYAGDRQILEDMGYLIREDLPPAKRSFLDPWPSRDAPEFWTFRH